MCRSWNKYMVLVFFNITHNPKRLQRMTVGMRESTQPRYDYCKGKECFLLVYSKVSLQGGDISRFNEDATAPICLVLRLLGNMMVSSSSSRLVYIHARNYVCVMWWSVRLFRTIWFMNLIILEWHALPLPNSSFVRDYEKSGAYEIDLGRR